MIKANLVTDLWDISQRYHALDNEINLFAPKIISKIFFSHASVHLSSTMSLPLKTNWLLEIVWFTSKGINVILWAACIVIVLYYLIRPILKVFKRKIRLKEKATKVE